MKLKAFGATEQRIYNAVKPIAEKFGFQIWDVRFEKKVLIGISGFSSIRNLALPLRTAKK